jgi:hypothetical protein
MQQCGRTVELMQQLWPMIGIRIEAAKRTCIFTTQRGVHRMIHPSLTKHSKTNYSQMKYLRLPVTCFTDKMFSSTNSKDVKKVAQVFCTADGCTISFPMKKES